MMKRFSFAIVLLSSSLQAMVFDNRFLPLYFKPHMRRLDAPSSIRVQPFFMHADRAFSESDRLNIPDIEGTYDQVSVANALVGKGFEQPLRSDFQLRTTLPWARRGRLDAQGVAFYYEQTLGCYASFGFDTFFAHVDMRHEFFLRGAELQLSPGDREYLFEVKDKMHRELGVTPPFFRRTGFGDIDFYLRFGSSWEYTLKFRRIDADLKIGGIIPTGALSPCDNPAGIPLAAEKPR